MQDKNTVFCKANRRENRHFCAQTGILVGDAWRMKIIWCTLSSNFTFNSHDSPSFKGWGFFCFAFMDNINEDCFELEIGGEELNAFNPVDSMKRDCDHKNIKKKKKQLCIIIYNELFAILNFLLIRHFHKCFFLPNGMLLFPWSSCSNISYCLLGFFLSNGKMHESLMPKNTVKLTVMSYHIFWSKLIQKDTWRESWIPESLSRLINAMGWCIVFIQKKFVCGS